MKKSEIFVPLSRNRTRKNDRDGFREVFCTGSGVLYGGGRPGAGYGQETGICKAAEKRRVPKMAFRVPGGRQQPGTDRLVQTRTSRRDARAGWEEPCPPPEVPGAAGRVAAVEGEVRCRKNGLEGGWVCGLSRKAGVRGGRAVR